jgi:hypothetical protein
MTKSLFAGIDLHSNNLMIGIVDQTGQRLKHQKLDCDLQQVVQFLKPFQPRFKSLADRKKTVFDEDLVSLVETEVIYKSVPEHFKLVGLVVLAGTMAQPSANVKMEVGGHLVGPRGGHRRCAIDWPEDRQPPERDWGQHGR